MGLVGGIWRVWVGWFEEDELGGRSWFGDYLGEDLYRAGRPSPPFEVQRDCYADEVDDVTVNSRP